MGIAYNNGFKIELNKSYSIEEIKNAINKLLEILPVLKTRLINNNGTISFSFDAQVELREEIRHEIESFMKPFELDKSLSRFLICADDDSASLYVDFHHLIFDGTSLNIILDNLFSILNKNEVDYVDDGVLRQISFEENIDENHMDDAQKFFDSMLEDIDETYGLLPSVDGDNEFEYLDSLEIDDNYLNSFLMKHRITPNQFFTSVFAYTLSRFTGSSKVLFNLVEDGRGHINLSDSVGMYVKTLPLLIDCENKDISSYLNYSSNLINSVMKYDFYPFRILANEYDLKTDIIFQYSHNLFDKVLNEGEFNYNVYDLKQTLISDLAFFIFNADNNKLGLRILYSEKFSKSFIKQFVKSYKFILQEITRVNQLSEINYTDSSDLKYLNELNATESTLKYDDILDAFNDNLSKYPNNNLVSFNDKIYSFEEGAAIADEIAKKLCELGVNKQDCVSFLVERSEWYIFSSLAILSIGAIYVPLDDAHPDERIEFILKDTQSKVLIVSDETYGRAQNLSTNIAILNISDIPKDNVEPLSSLPIVYGDLACILYTSGTTGIPKGVKITRKGITSYVDFYVNEYNMKNNSVFGLFASIGFDVGAIRGICAPLFGGSCLDIIPMDIRLNIDKLNKHFINQNVTHTTLPTQVAKMFIDEIEDTTLEVLITGGEKLGEIDASVDYSFIDSYGPTECCVAVCAIEEQDKIDSTSIGYLFTNIKAYVLDNEQRRVPVGAVGELCISGNQVADGYLNRQKETDESFMKNPFDDDTNYNMMYCTGDLVRVLPDGSFGIIGRQDKQVKIRGNRIELSEIESVIHENSYVESVTVQTIKHEGHDKLVAYVVLSEEISNYKDLICDWVRESKPDYMIPSFIIKLDEIPLNVNGKVDKHALPDVDLNNLHAEYVAPRNENEKIVVEAFEKVFNRENISIYDDFTHFGGDSLTAIRCLSYIENNNITAADILSLHTPFEIAKKINENSFNLDLYNLDDGCPLNESQLNVYLDIITNNKFDSYILPLSINIPKKYSVNELCNALRKMIGIHPILGMCIRKDFEDPYLVKGKEPQILVKSDCSDEFIMEFKSKVFNLTDSLCRFLIANDGNTEDFTLYAVFHHLIFDGLSIPIFEQELQSILEKNDENNPIPLDNSFLKVSSFNKIISKIEPFNEAHDFFNSMLADFEETSELLGDIDGDCPGTYSINLNFDNTLFNNFLNEQNINENVLFTSTFAYTLSRFTGSDKVLFNIIENGRDRFANYNAIGMFVNVLPILVNCSNQKISSYMNSMFNLIYDVMKYNYYPFRFLANEYDLDINILFQYKPYWFNNTENRTMDIPDMDNLIKNSNNLISDFVCEIIQFKDNYKLRITYSDKYSKATVERFSQVYNLILSQIIHNNNLSEINYITPFDLKLLDSYNKTERKLQHNDILDAFVENLSKYPDNNLVSMDDRTYTYSEGAYIINEIVNRLKELNIKSGDCISFLVNRSEWYLFTALSILSIGGVYVPLDDAHPDERIKFILDDTQSKAIIVTDDTYERARNLTDKCVILNVSDILTKSIKSMNNLDVKYSDLGCILYTSGTTGVPKGVEITRKAILNASSVYVDKYKMDNNDVYGFYVSIGFDVGSLGLWATIYAGASLAIVPENIKLDIVELNDYFIKHNVTYSAITAQVAKLFIQNIKYTSLKVLSVGGEKLGDIQSPDYLLIDEYGPTETFGFVSSINNLNKIDSSSVGLINYNTKVYILDNEYRRVPNGAVGELYIAGHQIANGYINREEETAKAFINNPFEINDNYKLMYRTGDMVRYLPDGSIAILGRRDRQVKIRGNRVELSEVESTIRKLDYVKDVTVQTIKNESNNELVAYVVLSEEIDDVKNYICDYISENKPNYMVPSFVINLDEIPLTVNGKVDTRKLPAVTIENKLEYEYPIDFIEKAIAKGFKEVLNVTKPISRNDEFNALGGDSISVMMLIVKLRNINLHVSVKEVLENQSVKKIAEKVEYKLSTTNISQKSFEGYVDETPITNYFWDLNLKCPSYFNQPLLFECSEKIDENILEKAMQTVVNHHDMLRSKIKDGKLHVSKINSEKNFTIENCNHLDYSGETERINKGIDIFNGPLIKLGIFDEGNVDYLYIAIHHLIVDGISWRIISEDLNLAYLQLANNKEIELPTKTSTYQDYALAINKYKSNEELLNQKSFWEDTFNDLMNIKHTKIGKKPRKMETIQLTYSKEKTSILFTNAIKYYDASINGLFLSAISKSWNKVTGEDELSVRIESHGRENFDENLLIERTVGWFSTAYPVILKYSGHENKEIIEHIEKTLRDIPQNGFAYPILMGIETDEMPLLTFNYLGEMNGIKTGEMFIPKFKSDLAPAISLENDLGCDININGYSINKECIFELKYNINRFSHEIIEQFAGEIIKTLDEFVESCDKDDYTDDIRIFSHHHDKKNLFIIHSANFGSEFFYYLAEELKEDYSFYVIEPYNLNHKEAPLTSVEEFAEKYIEMIKSIQPEGPYYLGGFCFGGSIAHEMSIQLKKQNEKVEKLVIFDANYIEDKELQKILIEHQILFAHKHQQGGVLNPKEVSVGDMAAQARLAGSIWLNYTPNYYDGETIFFKSSIKPKDINEDASMMYDHLLSKKAAGFEDYYDNEKLKIIEVPVEHNHIFSVAGLRVIVPEVKKFIDYDEKKIIRLGVSGN